MRSKSENLLLLLMFAVKPVGIQSVFFKFMDAKTQIMRKKHRIMRRVLQKKDMCYNNMRMVLTKGGIHREEIKEKKTWKENLKYRTVGCLSNRADAGKCADGIGSGYRCSDK